MTETRTGGHAHELAARVAELERDRELLNAIANYAPSLICLVDADGRVRPTATNRAFEITLGYDPGESGGDLFWEKYVHADDAEATRAAIAAAVRGEPPQERDARWVTRTGELVDVAWSCTALPPIASGPVFLVSATDIRERKRHEEEIRESRARIVEAADTARRRLERNLHDGAQQRLVSLLLKLRSESAKVAPGDPLEPLLATALEELTAALTELRELARGIHPALLTERGLRAALVPVAERGPVPVELDVVTDRFDERIEAAAYFVVSEALANLARHADATSARVTVATGDGSLVVEVADDGIGGADVARGSGLRGLADRVAALDGALVVDSRPGAGTTVRAVLPLP